MNLPAVPSGWKICRLKDIAHFVSDVLPEDTDLNYEFEYVDIGNVSSQGKVVGADRLTFGAAPSRARRRVRKGDTIISTVRTYLKAVALIDEASGNLIVSTAFAVLRPKPQIGSTFLWRLLQSEDFLANVVAHSDGVGYPAISPSKLMSLPVWLPVSEGTQSRVLKTLDHKVEAVDALIESKRQLVRLLKQRIDAMVLEAVTGGARPKKDMQPSGIPTIPFVPSDWHVLRNKTVFREIDERVEAAGSNVPDLLSVSHLTGVASRADKQVYMFLAESPEGNKICEKGDLVINTMWAWMGAAGTSPTKGMVSPSYHVYRFRTPQAHDSRYWDFLVRTSAYVAEMGRHSKGVWRSRLRLYPDVFLTMLSPVPSPDEQRAIVRYLTAELEPSERMIATLHESIAMLQESRNALISSAMTGVMDKEGRAA